MLYLFKFHLHHINIDYVHVFVQASNYSLIMHPGLKWTLANVMTAARDLTDSEIPYLSLNYLRYDKK